MANSPREESFVDFFRTATGGFTPYRWQLQVAVDGLPDVLSVPTGLGKTEVALAWAWRLLRGWKCEPPQVVVLLSSCCGREDRAGQKQRLLHADSDQAANGLWSRFNQWVHAQARYGQRKPDGE